MSESFNSMTGVAAALGIGMLVGFERERRKGQGESRASAGLRTFTISALLGYVAIKVGGALLLAIAAGGLALLVAVAYWRSQSKDPGLTSEVALITVLVLGALCSTEPRLAIALGVIVAGLLAYRQKLHDIALGQLTEGEIRDGLILLIAALVLLPLAPDRYIDPYTSINPHTIWTLTVLLLTLGAVGHIAVRILGTRYGYVISAIASGFASSTATIAAMGNFVASQPGNIRTLAAAGIFSNLATMAQVGLILGAVDISLLRPIWIPLLCGAAATAFYGLCLMRSPRAGEVNEEPVKAEGAFSLKLALIVTLTMTGITFLSAVMLDQFGQAGVMITATLTGFADAHSSTASIAALAKSGQLPITAIVAPALIAVSSNSVSKCVVAWISGGRQFAMYVIPGQVLLTLAMWLGVLWS